MTLEERIKNIKGYIKEFLGKPTFENAYQNGLITGQKRVAEESLLIIQELQTKNKELETKLKELNNDR